MSRVGRFYVIVYNGMEISNVLECLLIDKGFDVSSRDEVNEFNMFYLIWKDLTSFFFIHTLMIGIPQDSYFTSMDMIST